MTRGGDIIGGWRLDCGCIHQLLTIRAGAYESIHCPLHAAAPTLLEALERLVHRLDVHYGGDPAQDWHEQSDARAAIAQAKGK